MRHSGRRGRIAKTTVNTAYAQSTTLIGEGIFLFSITPQQMENHCILDRLYIRSDTADRKPLYFRPGCTLDQTQQIENHCILDRAVH